MENKQNMRNGRDDVIEIDLLQILLEFKKRIWIILAAMILGGGLAGAYSVFALTPQYTSSAMVYILSKETTLTSLADLQIGSQLTLDYKVIVTSRPVLQDVIHNLGLDMTYRQLAGRLKIDNPTNTRILTIAATDPDPETAKKIVDEVASRSADYIADIMEMAPPKIIETGEVPTEKTSPSNTKNAMIGALAGMVLVCGLITLEVIMNDSVRTEEDVVRYLELSVLAAVPVRENETAEDKEAMAKNKPASSDQHGKNRAPEKRRKS
ncbi:MAG: Wzz/FepE/Etk N-terminal domain-containing protein [Clostridiales bacterium]|nr:Wzz/FepE/Etk N-terminal domain-containing protein [Clostridiales bacterium]